MSSRKAPNALADPLDKPAVVLSIRQADRIRGNLAIMYGVVEGACAYIATECEYPTGFLLSNALHLQFERLENELRPLVGCGFY